MKKMILSLLFGLGLIISSLPIALAVNDNVTETQNSNQDSTSTANQNGQATNASTNVDMPADVSSPAGTPSTNISTPAINTNTTPSPINSSSVVPNNNQPEKAPQETSSVNVPENVKTHHIAAHKHHHVTKHGINGITAVIKLTQQQDKLFAFVMLTQPQATPGNIRLLWKAPTHSGCSNSEYTLQYQNKRYHTRAYRTLVHGHLCTGRWHVKVLDSNGHILSHAAIEIVNK